MEKELIERTKKEIDIAVKVFRETLEKTYLNNDKAFYGVGMHPLMNFFEGKVSVKRKSNGNLKLSGELPSFVLNKNVVGLPRNPSDWAILPIVFTFFQEDIMDDKK